MQLDLFLKKLNCLTWPQQRATNNFQDGCWVAIFDVKLEPKLQGLDNWEDIIRLVVKNPIIGLRDVGWLVGFVALSPKSTAMVIAGRSVHLTTLFPGQA